jgi:hypothetical protein
MIMMAPQFRAVEILISTGSELNMRDKIKILPKD